jgi:hypothetical protein
MERRSRESSDRDERRAKSFGEKIGGKHKKRAAGDGESVDEDEDQGGVSRAVGASGEKRRRMDGGRKRELERRGTSRKEKRA